MNSGPGASRGVPQSRGVGGGSWGGRCWESNSKKGLLPLFPLLPAT